MTKPNWNRLAALEFAGRVLTGRTDIRAGEAQAHADWALQWLGGDQPNPERAPGGYIEPVVPGPDWEKVRLPVPPGFSKDMARMNEAARKLRSVGTATGRFEHVNGDPRDNDPKNMVPRNVPVEGDGSATPPIYRFYAERRRETGTSPGGDLSVERQHVLGVYSFYWREDTRNTVNRWSLWSGPEPENGIPCWTSRRDYDRGGQYAPPPVDQMVRLTTAQLDELDIPVETRYDSEE